MPPRKRKSKEAVTKEAAPPSVIQPKAKGAKEVKVTATFSRPKRSTTTTEAAEAPSLPLPRRKASTTAVKSIKRGSDPNEKLDGEIKTKKVKTAPKKAAAPAKVPVSTRKPASSKAKAKLPPFVKGSSSSKRPVGRPRGRPRKIAPKPLDTTHLPKTPPPKTPESSDVDISSILPVNLRRGSTFSVEITKKEDDSAQRLDEETEDEIEEDEEGDERAYWLMKAEPESRIEKGIDVKFSIDDFDER